MNDNQTHPRSPKGWTALWISISLAIISILAPQGLQALNTHLATRNADVNMIKLPSVDISPFFNPQSTPAQLHYVAQQIADAASDTGCLFLVGHGFTLTQQTATLAAAHELMHGVSPAARQEFSVKPGKLARGFVPLAGESGAADLVEVKEGFSFGYEWPSNEQPSNVLQGPNVWPNPKDGLSLESKKHLQNAFKAMVKVSNTITHAVALAIGQDPTAMSQLCEQGESISIMRIFRYMARGDAIFNNMCESAGDSKCTGSSPHTDWGYLTLILQGQDPSEQQSLELWDTKRNTWRQVASPTDAERGALVMNAGDFLALLSGGRFRSPRHRVVLTSAERISLVFFGYPNADASLDELAGGAQQDLSLFEVQEKQTSGDVDGVGGAAPKLDTTLTFGDYIAKKWEQVARG